MGKNYTEEDESRDLSILQMLKGTADSAIDPTLSGLEVLSGTESAVKDALDRARNTAAIELDFKKIAHRKRISDTIDYLLGVINDPAVQERIKNETATALDIKALADALASLVKQQQTLARLDSIDGETTGSAVAIRVTTSHGDKIELFSQNKTGE